MKKISITRLVLLSFLITLFSCDDDDDTLEPVTITMSFNDISITIPESFDVSNQQMVKISDYLTVETSNNTEANVTYSIVSQSVPNAISIAGEYLVINQNFELDFETNPILTAEIKATAGEVSETATITINLTDEHEPIWTVQAITVTMDENPTETTIDTIRLEDYDADLDGTLTYSISNQSPEGALQIVDDSIVAVNDAALFDFETNPTITATIEVTNGNGYSQTADLSISLNDMYESTWTIDDFELTIDENPEDEDFLGLVKLIGFDSDKDSQNFTVQLLDESPTGAIEVDVEDIFLTVKDPSLFDYETNPTITAKIQISDDNGYTQTGNITITVNEPYIPSWTIEDFELTIDENPEDEDDLGRVDLVGFDYEKDSRNFTMQLIDESPAGAIELHYSEKIFLTVKDPSLFDYETNPTITAKIQISDENGYTQTGNITITLNDADEAINIPDANFKNALLTDPAININGDSEITESEALSFTGNINAPSSSIEDVTGIEYFINVTRISLFDNDLTSIDLSNNTKVTQLLIEKNSLTSIDISKLTQLVDFKAHTNNLTSANLANGNNGNMTRMQIQGNSALSCIKVDILPVPYYGWSKDSSATYSTNCD
ncbi:hypothetical protein [Chondrinema litorale]|uniref:hypothetical protein n=1 Tax=Chondrinema litorale TaxID=2994555 RepID=UPI00254297AE|nr:hypothetical protein [Chondrinema litorale]UZR96466.1 hypothetical protein OQ292_22675 [Chondrinema litorale]